MSQFKITTIKNATVELSVMMVYFGGGSVACITGGLINPIILQLYWISILLLRLTLWLQLNWFFFSNDVKIQITHVSFRDVEKSWAPTVEFGYFFINECCESNFFCLFLSLLLCECLSPHCKMFVLRLYLWRHFIVYFFIFWCHWMLFCLFEFAFLND